MKSKLHDILKHFMLDFFTCFSRKHQTCMKLWMLQYWWCLFHIHIHLNKQLEIVQNAHAHWIMDSHWFLLHFLIPFSQLCEFCQFLFCRSKVCKQKQVCLIHLGCTARWAHKPHTQVVYHGESWKLLEHPGASWKILENLGESWSIQVIKGWHPFPYQDG